MIVRRQLPVFGFTVYSLDDYAPTVTAENRGFYLAARWLRFVASERLYLSNINRGYGGGVRRVIPANEKF
jgi:hypothetical protein